MNLEQLERFVMDTIDVLTDNPKEYTAEGAKGVIRYRFELHRNSLKGKGESKLQEIIRHRRNFSISRGIEWVQQFDRIINGAACLDGDEGWEEQPR